MVVLSAAIVAGQIAAAPIIGFGFGVGYTLGARTGYEIVFELLKAGKKAEAEKLLFSVREFARDTGTSAATEFGLTRYFNDINTASQSIPIENAQQRGVQPGETDAAVQNQIITGVGTGVEQLLASITTAITNTNFSSAFPSSQFAGATTSGSTTVPLTAVGSQFTTTTTTLQEKIDQARKLGMPSVTIDGLTYNLNITTKSGISAVPPPKFPKGIGDQLVLQRTQSKLFGISEGYLTHSELTNLRKFEAKAQGHYAKIQLLNAEYGRANPRRKQRILAEKKVQVTLQKRALADSLAIRNRARKSSTPI